LLTSSLPTIATLLGSAVVIYLACEYFVNGVEWVGRLSGLSRTAVGTVLAAFGTALPESVVTLIAVVSGKDEAARSIGIGAALGGPLVLSTIAYAVVGIMLILVDPTSARKPVTFERERLMRDQRWFLAIFAVKLGLGFVAFAIKPWLGVLFLAAYALYVRAELRDESGGVEEDLEPLSLQPRAAQPRMLLAIVQTVIALAVIYAASHWFVGALAATGPLLGLPPSVVALLLSPVATELPETMNAIIWIRQRKTGLALANISGAMMIQATVPTALGLFYTPWRLGPPMAVAGAITALSIAGLLWLLARQQLTPRRMAALAAGYGVFAVVIVMLWQRGLLA
jgi:cation:H+ antiporter